jgi:hypothetical protein
MIPWTVLLLKEFIREEEKRKQGKGNRELKGHLYERDSNSKVGLEI